MERDDILRELMALDFIAVDLQLFLDTHPGDEEALREYNRTLERAEEYRIQYQRMCGPLYSYRSLNPGSWKWYKDPWPWQFSANFDLPEGCC